MSHQQTSNLLTATLMAVFRLPKTTFGNSFSNITKAGKRLFTTGVEMTTVLSGSAANSLYPYELLPLPVRKNVRLNARRIDLKTKWVFS